jgi:plastocyanin
MLGTGLSKGWLGAILAGSVLFFLFWGGPLWASDPNDSHVLRIGLSYLLVVPLAAGALALRRRLRATRLATATGAVWAVKLVVTSLLFLALAPGEAQSYAPATARLPAAPRSSDRRGYVAATAAPTLALTGHVSSGGSSAPGVAVWLDAPPPGRPLGAPEALRVRIGDAGFERAVLVASRIDPLSLENTGAVLHTVRIADAGRTVANQPLPAGTGHERRALDPGVYDLSCATHAGEHASLIVVDHPYAGQTDAAGAFVLPGVPTGNLRIRALGPDGASASSDARAGTEVLLDLAQDRS